MLKNIKFVSSLIICFVLIGVLGAAPTAQAAPYIPLQHQDYKTEGAMISGKITATDITEASSHWTLEARKAALPMGLLSVKQSDFNAMPNYSVSGNPGAKSGGLPAPDAAEKAKTNFPDAWAALSNRNTASLPTKQAANDITPYGTKNVFDGYYANYYNNMWLYYPYSTVGRLYFTDGLYNYYCSASLISPNNIIVTAAHCVYNTDLNYLYYNWIFVPADYGGLDPLGYYPADNFLFWASWANAKKSSSAMQVDLALLHLTGSPSYYAGYLGYAWNQNPKSLDHTMGYADNKYSGISSYICVAEGFQKKSDVLGMGCDMTFGSSGSPWILDFEPYNWYAGYANGVVSGGIVGIPTFYGPRFSIKNFLPLCLSWGC